MQYTNTPVSAPESTSLAADTYVAIPFTVKETNAVPAGYPMAKTGLKAAATTASKARRRLCCGGRSPHSS